MFYVQSAVTCCALFWLLHRAWQTLWKPVPELISILGVEVPDAPQVSLAGIKVDAVTLHWTRPAINKPVVRYLIQVNGVNVGDSSRTETAITVTGLKPGHFYNVRVIAVGSNNFQAGSRVIRLRTYGRDGRPKLDNGRVSSNLSVEDGASDSGDELPAVRPPAAGIEAAVPPEGPQVMQRESSNSHPGQRRNTGGRRHSPSNAAADQTPSAQVSSNQPEESMQQLTDRFESIRRETDDITGQMAKDTDEFKSQMYELTKDRDEKRQLLKEKEEASEKLKKDMNLSERANRSAQRKKEAREKLLRDKEVERRKMQDDMSKWKQEIESMKVQREVLQKEKEDFLSSNEAHAEELRSVIQGHHASYSILEEELRMIGLKMQELEAEKRSVPGTDDDEESREREANIDKQRNEEWDKRRTQVTSQISQKILLLRQLEQQYALVQQQYAEEQHAFNALQANTLMHQGNSSGVDFDPTGQGKAKARKTRNRKSRTSTISSPIASYPISDSPFPSAHTYNNFNTTSPSFAPGPYIDYTHNDIAMVPMLEQSHGMSDAEIRALTAGAPLSPTATALLPSNIFNDDDIPPSPRTGSTKSLGPSLFGPISQSAFDNDPQSPASSSRSPSQRPSPQASSHSLAKYGVSGHDYVPESDQRSLNSPRAAFGAIGPSNNSGAAPPNRSFSNFLPFSKSRVKTMPADGLPLGSLKQGQSQSFPRSTDEPVPESIARHRRTSFSSGWSIPSIFRGLSMNDASEGNAPAPARNQGTSRRRGFNSGNSLDDPKIFSDREPSSPRPLSIASSEFPRPSTDSAPFGWPAAESGLKNRNSPLATNWSVGVHPIPQAIAPPWSRNPSRRPSIQHGSSTGLSSGVADEDDEFLLPDTIAGQSSPTPVGVIGTRPPSSRKPVTPKLNPAAPTFSLGFLSSKPDKDKDKSKAKSKDKAGEKSAGSDGLSKLASTSSPTESRMSRDTYSIHTQNSMAESHESLDRTSSNTPSEMMNPPAGSAKDKESSFRQLLRKGSSSKFSLFGGKKGTSSAANSDRAERDSSIDGLGDDAPFGKSVDSVTSSPMLGSLASGEWKVKDKDSGTPKEGSRMSNWSRAFIRKKGQPRESSEAERSEAETTGTDDDEV